MPRSREEAPVESRDTIEGERKGFEQGDAGVVSCEIRKGAFVADVPPGQREAGLAIVLLLREHAIEPDSAAGEPFHARAPDLEP